MDSSHTIWVGGAAPPELWLDIKDRLPPLPESPATAEAYKWFTTREYP